MVELSVLGISLQEDGSVPVLLLYPQGSQRILSLRIGPMEAFAISSALRESERFALQSAEAEKAGPQEEKEPSSRPLTHDLLLRMNAALGGRLLAVELLRMTEGAFVAEAVLEGVLGEVRVDCRPSDGVALALRCGARISAADEVLAHAEHIDMVMANLPEHIRALVAVKLNALRAEGRASAVIASVKEAAAYVGRKEDPHREVLSAARKMLEEEKALKKAEPPTEPLKPVDEASAAAEEARAPRIILEEEIVLVKQNLAEPSDNNTGQSSPDASGSHSIVLSGPGKPGPTIRISLVRQHAEGEAEILDEFLFPSSGIPREVLGSLSLSQAEVRAVGNALSEEDRWAALLRILAPETKEQM